ncbi:MAG TPA: hypothetical protein PLV68_04760, partial [Ilumatobacteraceae bacterium]|nr:hypothetical protein [Ilumatobacteraceae bacterium]
RYITDRFLPDKAIDLVDEAASRLRMEIDSKPAELDVVDRDIMQREIEREALKKEKDKASKERLKKLEEELANLKEHSTQLTARWQAEKEAIERIQSVKEEIDQVNVQIEQAQRAMDYQKAAELQYGRLHALEKSLKQASDKLTAMQQDGAMLKEEVGAEEIAQIVAKWTGIPVSKLLEGEVEKLVLMEDRLHDRVVGQDEAIRAVAAAVRRAIKAIEAATAASPQTPAVTFGAMHVRDAMPATFESVVAPTLAAATAAPSGAPTDVFASTAPTGELVAMATATDVIGSLYLAGEVLGADRATWPD